jgi:hypothetical protein
LWRPNNHEWRTLPGEFKASLGRFTNSNGEQIINLRAAHLETADFKEAVLEDAKGYTHKQLVRQAGSLEDAFMPDGQKYEAWLETTQGQN